MRVVLVHRYFAPDTPPYAHLLREVALALGGAGHDVQVLTCQPSYNRAVVAAAPARELIGPNVAVRRWQVLPDRSSAAIKLVNLVWFCARLVFSFGAFRRADVVMAASTPPIAVAKVTRFLAARAGARFVYHKQDIYPEVVVAPGILRAGRWAALLRWLDARTDRAATRVVVLSEDMADTIVQRGVERGRIAVINNFDPWTLSGQTAPGVNPGVGGDGRLNVVFAGNLGRFQNLETVFAAIEELKDDSRFAFHFFGTGVLAGELADRVERGGLDGVHLYGYQQPEVVAEFLRAEADVGIVSLMPGVIRAAYPSKTMSYLRQGCPVLAIVETESALARSVESSGAGVYADPTDAHAVADALRRLAGHPQELMNARKAAARLYAEEFAASRQLARWTQLFEHQDAA